MASNPKISIKWKLFAVVAVLITVAVFVIVTHTSSIFRQDKEAFVKELSAKLASSTAKTFLTRITTLQDKLVIFISSRESLAHTGARADEQLQVLFSRYQDFLAIAFLTPDDMGRLKVDWVMRNPQGPANQWPANYEKSFLSSLNVKAAGANGRGFWRTQAPNGDWLSVLGFGVQVLDLAKPKTVEKSHRGTSASAVTQKLQTSEKMAWIVGILPGNTFDDLLSDFSTGLNTGFVVDDQGFAVAHSDPASRWKNLKALSIVDAAIKGDRPAETGDFTDDTGRAVIGSFEFIPKMNLVAVVTTPRDKAFEAADTLSRDIFFIGTLILLISLAVAVLLSNYLTGPLQRLAAVAARIGGGDFKVPVDVESNDEIGDLAISFRKMEQGLIERDEKLNSTQMALVQSEKMSAFGQLSAGIAHEVKNPLAGILGHAQLAMGKVKTDDVKKHLEVIEKETRRCKTIVENLMKFARAEKAELKPTNLAQVVQDTINLVDHQLTLAGCKIYKDFRACPMVDANGNMLQQVLLNLMVNSSHAMENCPTKNVTVRVLQVGNKAQMQVQDTGSGIPPEIQKKIFEPFFTTKPAGKGTGLGLSVSIGIVKDHKGEIYIKSEQGQGTTFFIDIPIPENAAMPDKPLENTHGGQVVSSSEAADAVPTPVVQTPAAAASSKGPPPEPVSIVPTSMTGALPKKTPPAAKPSAPAETPAAVTPAAGAAASGAAAAKVPAHKEQTATSTKIPAAATAAATTAAPKSTSATTTAATPTATAKAGETSVTAESKVSSKVPTSDTTKITVTVKEPPSAKPAMAATPAAVVKMPAPLTVAGPAAADQKTPEKTAAGALPRGLPKFKVQGSPSSLASGPTPAPAADAGKTSTDKTKTKDMAEAATVIVTKGESEKTKILASEEEFIFSDATKTGITKIFPAKGPSLAAGPSLGGKGPVDEKTVNLPEIPSDAESVDQNSFTGTGTRTDNSLVLTQGVSASKQDVSPSGLDVTGPGKLPAGTVINAPNEFKVKIKRPKLKV